MYIHVHVHLHAFTDRKCIPHVHMYMYVMIVFYSPSENCRVIAFSCSGSLVAWCDGERYNYTGCIIIIHTNIHPVL